MSKLDFRLLIAIFTGFILRRLILVNLPLIALVDVVNFPLDVFHHFALYRLHLFLPSQHTLIAD